MALSIIEETGLSDVGRHRQANEDSYFMSAPVYAVADGMGGAQAGEVASRIAVEQFESMGGPGAGPEATLAEIARTANRRIHELARADQSRAGMGTTLSAAMVSGDEVSIGHVGDSRIYRFRDDRLERLTTDHSYVQELVSQGRLTPEEAEVHPQSAIITRALGPEPEVEVDTFTIEGHDGDIYLICSDGLTGMVREGPMADILRGAGSLDDAASELVHVANENGGRDNITVVLFRLGEAVGGAGGDDKDTLTGSEDGIDARRVRAAVAAAEIETEAEGSRRHGTRDAAEVHQTGLASNEDAAPVRAATRERTRGRRRHPALASVLVLLVVAGLLGAGYGLARQVFFVGAGSGGLLTVSRGLPYAPLGIELHRALYTSTVAAASLAPARRAAVLERWPRSHADAFDLIRSIERDARPDPALRPARARRRSS